MLTHMLTRFRLCACTLAVSAVLSKNIAFSCEAITVFVTAVRALNITFRSGNPCGWGTSYGARLYVSNLVLRTKNGSDRARAAGVRIKAKSVYMSSMNELEALDTSNSS
jgi:hypothetical protein